MRPSAGRGGERGFTLVELLVVLMLIGILLAIAVPSYLGSRGRGADTTAQANLRAIEPTIASYYTDNGTYVGMTVPVLRQRYDQALPRTGYRFRMRTATAYCVEVTVAGVTWNKPGPGGSISAGRCT